MQRLILLFMVLLLVGGESLSAQEAASAVQPLNPEVKYLVISEKARVMAGDNASGTAVQGSVVAATYARGPWRFSALQKGWLHEADLIPIHQAVDHFTQQISQQPTALAHQLRGIAWSARNEWQKAATDFEQAFTLGDNSVSLHYNLGLAYRELAQFDKALGEFDSVLKLYPDDYKSLVARANLYVQAESFDKALVDLDRAIALNPAVAELHNERGVSLRMLDRYMEAVESYSKAIALEPKHAEALSNRAFALKSTANYVDALKDYRAALEADPKSTDIQNDLAWFLATCPESQHRQPLEAVQLAKKICEASDFKTGEFVDTLAAAYASQGEFASAVTTEKLAIPLLEGRSQHVAAQERLKLYEAGLPYLEQPRAGKAAPEPTPGK